MVAAWAPSLAVYGIPILFMLLVGFYRLGDRSLTLDETTSYFLTQIGWDRFFEVVVDSKANMSLYFAFLRLWPFTGDEAGLRALSVIFGVLTVLPLVAIARRFLPAWLVIAAAIAFAINPLFIHELHDARAYSLAVLLSVTGTWVLLVALESDRGWPWIAYAAVMGSALYAHFLTGMVIVAHVALLATSGALRPRLPVVVAAVILTIAALPVAAVVLLQGGTTLAGVERTTWESVYAAFVTVSGSEPAVGIYLLALLVGAVLWLDRARSGGLPVALRATYLAGVLTITLIILVSLVKPLLLDRYLLIAVPFLALAVVGAFAVLSWKLAATAALVLIGSTVLGAYAELTATYENPAGWVRHFISSAAAGDGVIFDDQQDRKVLAYYLTDPLASSVEVVGSTNPITVNPYEERPSGGGMPAVPFRTALREMACDYERVWLIGGPEDLPGSRDSRTQAIARNLARSYDGTDVARYGNRFVRLFERKATVSC